MRKTLGIIDTYTGLTDLISQDFSIVNFNHTVFLGVARANCDALLLQGTEQQSNLEWYYSYLGDIEVLGYPRLSKLQQHAFFSNNDIRCPRYFYTSSASSFALTSLLEVVPDETQLIVKSMFGARGLQQFLISKRNLVQKSPSGLKTETNKFKKKESIKRLEDPEDVPQISMGGVENDQSLSIEFSGEKSSSWLITERIPLKREFRILNFANGEYLICERHVNLNHFQNNLSVGSKVSYYGSDWSKLEEYKIQIISAAEKIRKAYPKAPYFSLDVYVDSTDNVGLFEFAQEFGFDALDFGDVRKNAVDSIRGLLSDN